MSEIMSKEKAYEVLGLENNASAEAVKSKYENLMRRQKYDKSFDVDMVTKAYDTIMGYDWGNFEKDEAYTKKGLNKKKVDNFFYHYKRSLIYGTIVVVLVVTILISLFSGNKKVDFGVAFIGDLFITQVQEIEQHMSQKYEVENMMVNYVTYAMDQGESSAANVFRLLLILDEPKYNVLYVNEEVAKYLIDDKALVDLTDYLSVIGIDKNDERVFWYSDYDGNIVPGAIFVGEDVSLREYVHGFVPQYIGIAKRAKDKVKSAEFIKTVLNAN